MGVAPSFPFDDELRRIALARVLDTAPVTLLGDRTARRHAYAAAGRPVVTDQEDAEAIRRSLLFRAFVRPRPCEVAA